MRSVQYTIFQYLPISLKKVSQYDLMYVVEPLYASKTYQGSTTRVFFSGMASMYGEGAIYKKEN